MADSDTLCARCGYKRGLHRNENAQCPRDGREPRWPSTVKNEARAAEIYDERLRRYWSARSTTFAPVT